MDIGMLWFDNDPKLDLLSKVQKAALYFKNKYGEQPNLCFVHPNMISGEDVEKSTITVRSNNTMLLNHFWIGVHQSDEAKLRQAPIR